jgi:pimeloyl-ACP methyl ester carboxylesterase
LRREEKPRWAARGSADGAEAIADQLADHFTVVTYDRRGLSRSAAKRMEGYGIAAHASDAARLIASLSEESVFVFGSSIGALVGLELAVYHGAQVRMMIAHEPPLFRLLDRDEREEALSRHEEVLESFQRDGVPSAMNLMVALSGVDMNDRELNIPASALAADPQIAKQRYEDLRHFLTWDVPAVTQYEPDIAAITAARSRVVPAVGSTSAGALAWRCARALAAVLRVEVAEFPGGHSGYVLRPKAFAEKLVELFRHEYPHALTR